VSAYLFDTCLISNWFRKIPAIEAKIQALPGSTLVYVSAISIGEVEFGHSSPKATDPIKQAEFRKWIRATFEIPELPITSATAQSYAMFRRKLCNSFIKKGSYIQNYEDALSDKIGIDENDLWLVAQAHERNLIFATSDKMHHINTVVTGLVTVELWRP
jgi:predicted nucleic acid-binding protein